MNKDVVFKKSELIKEISKRAGVSGTVVKEVLDALPAAIVSAVSKGNIVNIAGFGRFKCVSTKERTGRNPRTGETIVIKASKNLSFKPSSSVKDFLN